MESPKLCALHALLTYVLSLCLIYFFVVRAMCLACSCVSCAVCLTCACESRASCLTCFRISRYLCTLRTLVLLWYCVPLSLLASAVLCPVCSSSCVSCLAHWISQIFISYTHPKTEVSRKFWNLPKTEISKTFYNLSKHKFWLTLLRNLNFFIICQNRNSDPLDNKIY